MLTKLVLKEDLTDIPTSEEVYINSVREGLNEIVRKKKTSQNRLAAMSGLGSSTVSAFAGNKYIGDNFKVAKNLEPFLEPSLKQKENVSRPYTKNLSPLLTSVYQKVWAAIQMADQYKDVVVITGSAGIGKSSTLRGFQRQEISPTLIVADITKRRIGPILEAIGQGMEIDIRTGTQSQLLGKIIKILKILPRLLMFDEAHFLSWEAIEAIRVIHDTAHIGIVFCGQERFYEQMRGARRSYLFDQLLSRIGCHCRVTTIEKKDVRLICDYLYPNLDNKCLEFLFSKACGPGKFRVLVKVLRRAIFIAEKENVPVSLDLLREANSFLLF